MAVLPDALTNILKILQQGNGACWTLSHQVNGFELHIRWQEGKAFVNQVSTTQRHLHRPARKSAATKRRDRQRLERYLESTRLKRPDVQVSPVNVNTQTDMCVPQMRETEVQTDELLLKVSVATDCRPSQNDTETQVDVRINEDVDTANTPADIVDTFPCVPESKLPPPTSDSTHFRDDVSECCVRVEEEVLVSDDDFDDNITREQRREEFLRKTAEESKRWPDKMTDEILRSRVVKRTDKREREYLVKWEDSDDTDWVPHRDLDGNALALIVDWKYTSSGERLDRYPKVKDNVKREIRQDVERVCSIFCMYGKLTYEVRLKNGKKTELLEEEIPKILFDRYMNYGY